MARGLRNDFLYQTLADISRQRVSGKAEPVLFTAALVRHSEAQSSFAADVHCMKRNTLGFKQSAQFLAASATCRDQRLCPSTKHAYGSGYIDATAPGSTLGALQYSFGPGTTASMEVA